MEIQLDDMLLQLLAQYSVDHDASVNRIIYKAISREIGNYYSPKLLEKEIKQDADYFINGYCENHELDSTEIDEIMLLLEIGLSYLTIETMLMHKVNDDTNNVYEMMERIRLRFNGMSKNGLNMFFCRLINDYYECGSLIDNDDTGYHDDYDEMCSFYNKLLNNLMQSLDGIEPLDKIDQIKNLSYRLFEIYHNNE